MRYIRTMTDAALTPGQIFIMERIPTWMLARDSQFVAVARDPFVVRSRLYKVPGAVICDALKIAYAVNGRRPQYRELFELVSKMAKVFALQIRFGNFLGLKAIRACMTTGSAASSSAICSRRNCTAA